jgi:hypothetical protein
MTSEKLHKTLFFIDPNVNQLTTINPTEPCDNGRDDFLVSYTVSAQAGEQVYDKERQPTHYKYAFFISPPYRFHSIKQNRPVVEA